jgi:ABC-type polysaccharide/polyol phosphate transport system ATPase subunit
MRLKQIFFPGRKYYEEFWALKGISLSVSPGQALGVIGLNGAGKSTLLQILSGIRRQTTGTVMTNGRVFALLHLGMGFDGEFTGRENAYTNGAIIGISRKEMKEKIEDIKAFADIGEFFDRPVRMYSSGMKMRLGFAVAVNMEPDILLIDEVLSVGDFRYRQKCLEKIQEMRDKMSVIFVSHSMPSVTRFCDRVLVLNEGDIVYEGDPDDAVRFYMEEIWRKEEVEKEKSQDFPLMAFQGEMYRDEKRIADVEHKWVGENGEPIQSVRHGAGICLEFSFRLLAPARNLIVGIPVWNTHGELITAINTDVQSIEVVPDAGGNVRGKVTLAPVIFNPGEYHSMLTVVDGPKHLYREPNSVFRVEEMALHYGVVTVASHWDFS